eukprot:scaffold236489_cov19-Tisochrysis_lutea.AAC.2
MAFAFFDHVTFAAAPGDGNRSGGSTDTELCCSLQGKVGWRAAHSNMRVPSSILLAGAKQAGVLLMATCVFQVAHYFQAEPLLACVTMGMVSALFKVVHAFRWAASTIQERRSSSSYQKADVKVTVSHIDRRLRPGIPCMCCVGLSMLRMTKSTKSYISKRHERAEKDKDELHMLLAQIMSFTNVAFFGLAGASLKL